VGLALGVCCAKWVSGVGWGGGGWVSPVFFFFFWGRGGSPGITSL